MTNSDRRYGASGAVSNAPRGRVPRRALLISLAALAVPVYASVSDPHAAGEYEILLWLVALVPAFLLAYHRGWRGATLALAVGMGLLALSQAWVAAQGRGVPSWPLLLLVVCTLVAIALGVGWISELLHQARDQAEGLALTDELTGIANRRHARLILDQEFAAAQRGRPLAVVLFDLDHFKRYNDRHGHAAGDEALRAFAAVLRQTTRQMNLSARYGGEEFISVLSDSDVAGALVFLDRVRRGLAESGLPHPGFTFSAGLATFTPEMKDPDELIAAADTALYRAKELGRNRTSVFGSDGATVER
jgi:diguanylate cyclase (GGDEF)-like protein